MPRACTICTHLNRNAIETGLRDGTPFRNVAEQFKVSSSSVFRHKEHASDFLKPPTVESSSNPTVAISNPEEDPENEQIDQRLTIKQKLFVEHYLATRNGTLAARLAGYSGDSHQLSVTASRTLGNAGVRAEIDRRIQPHIISANEVLDLLSLQANGNMDSLLTEDGRLDLEKARRTGAIRNIKKLRFNKDGYIESAELYDAQAAMVHMGRKHKLFTDKTETEDVTPLQVDALNTLKVLAKQISGQDLTDDQVKELMAASFKRIEGTELSAMVGDLSGKFSLTTAQAQRVVVDVYGEDQGSDSVS